MFDCFLRTLIHNTIEKDERLQNSKKFFYVGFIERAEMTLYKYERMFYHRVDERHH